MSFNTLPLPNSNVGIQVTDLDLDKPISTEDQKALYDLWIDAGIIVFPGMGKNTEQQLNLSRCFGTLEVHPVKNLVTETDYPELMVLDSKDQVEQMVCYRTSEPDKPFVGFIPWHSDMIFVTAPNHGALLRSITNPKVGGQTAWIDTIAAYDALDEDMKNRIANLEVEYRFCSDLTTSKYGRDPEIRKQSGDVKFPSFPPVAHPMVVEHPVSKRKVLNISPLHLEGVVGMDEAESDALLQELVTHVTSRNFGYVHTWQPNDMVLWDNWRTLHSALGYPLGDHRVMHRTSISGNHETGRLLTA